MKIIDAHCDVLSKLWEQKSLSFDSDDNRLDANYINLVRGNIKIQFFAIYIPTSIQNPRFAHVKDFIKIYKNKIISLNNMKPITNQFELNSILHTEQIGAILTLEAVDALQANIHLVDELYQFGIRFIGITWNHANWAADGHSSQHWGKFTPSGKQLLHKMDCLGIIPDVSHLSEKCFWDLALHYSKPFIASHSNSSYVHPHSRNLSDKQIEVIIKRKGMIGINFVPDFITHHKKVYIYHIIKHIDHICALGGEHVVGCGSDFDGTKNKVIGLEHAGKFNFFADQLSKYFTAEQTNAFLFKNWLNFLQEHLPR